MDLKQKKIFYIAPVVLLVALIIFLGRPNSASAVRCANTILGNGFTCVQSAVSANTNPFPTLAYSSNNQAGNLLVAFIRSTGDKTVNSPAPMDTLGNTWQKASCVYRTNVGYSICLYYAENSKAGTNTVNANVSGNPDGVLILFEISGVKASGAMDRTSSSNGSGASIDSGAITTTNATDLLLGGVMAFGSTPNAGANWSPLDSLSQYDWLEYRSVSTAGTYNATASQNSSDWLAIEVAFKSSGSSPAPTPPPPAPPPSPSPTPTPTPSPIPTPPPAGGSDIYISQNGFGAQDASNCSNAKPVSFFNTTGNWGSGSGKIGPGVTVHLCGTFTGTGGSTMLTTQGNGSSGNPITILFEPGANLSSPYWNVSNGAIKCQNSYITIDGGADGVIKNTLNGTAGATCLGGPCTQQQQSRGVWGTTACTNAVVKNLTVTSLYIRTERTSRSNDPAGDEDTTGIAIAGGNALITHNTIDHANAAIGGIACNQSHMEASFNTMSFCQHCIGVGAAGNSCNIDDVKIHDNDIGGGAYLWDEPTNSYHHNPIFVFVDNAGGATNLRITNLQIYNNYIHGVWSRDTVWGGSHVTGLIFLDPSGIVDASINNAKIFNNVITLDAGDIYGTSNGVITSLVSSGLSIYNNTIVQNNGGVGICMRLVNSTGMDIRNNIMQGCGYAPQIEGVSSGNTVDYNLYYNTAGAWSYPGNSFGSFTQWQANGYDVHGKNGQNTLLDANYKPQVGSSALNAGGNLTSLGIGVLNLDKAGLARPATAPWDIGAYTSTGSVPPATPPPLPLPTSTPLAGDLNLDHVVNSLDFSLLNSKWNQNYSAYDLLVDGLINSFDYAVLKSNWGRTW